jgi:histidyl-tRNA synthetase
VTELLKSKLKAPSSKKKVASVGFMTEAERDAAIALAYRLRAEGKNVDLSLKAQKPKKFFSKTASSGATEAIFIGPDDVASGAVRMKNMETGEETTVCL